MIALASPLELNCVMILTNVCYNFDAETNKNNQDKAMVAKVNGVDPNNVSRCQDCMIISINENIFPQVEVIAFMGTKTQYLPLNIFHHLRNVKDFEVYSPHIKMVAPKNGHFFLADKMERIIIVNQRVEELPARVFEGANNVNTIKLENSMVNSLDEDAFTGLRKLEYLSISSNDINSLPAKLFATLRGLNILDLGSNMINALSKTLFDYNRNLEHIRLSHNRIMFLPLWHIPENTYYDLADNFCIDEVIIRTSDLNEITQNKCIIDKDSFEMVQEYRIQNEIDSICGDKNYLTTLQHQLLSLRKAKKQLLLKKEYLEIEIMKIKIIKNSFC